MTVSIIVSVIPTVYLFGIFEKCNQYIFGHIFDRSRQRAVLGIGVFLSPVWGNVIILLTVKLS